MSTPRKHRLDDVPEILHRHQTQRMRDKQVDAAHKAWRVLLDEVGDVMRAYGYRVTPLEDAYTFVREPDEGIVKVTLNQGGAFVLNTTMDPSDRPDPRLLSSLVFDPYLDAIIGRVRPGAYTRDGEPVRDSPLAIMVQEIVRASGWER